MYEFSAYAPSHHLMAEQGEDESECAGNLIRRMRAADPKGLIPWTIDRVVRDDDGNVEEDSRDDSVPMSEARLHEIAKGQPVIPLHLSRSHVKKLLAGSVLTFKTAGRSVRVKVV